MKLWLDDIRYPPSDWVWVKTVDQAISFLDAGLVDEVSLDNDLGEGQPEGKKVVLHMAEHGNWPETVRVHTANPVARDWMLAMIHRYKR